MDKNLVLVIFGATGDLHKRLLFPAVCNLGAADLLDPKFHMMGLGSEPFTTETFRAQLKNDVKQFVQEPKAQKFGLSVAESIDYLSGDFSDPTLYARLKTQLDDFFAKQKSTPNVLFYLAVPPVFFGPITTALGEIGLLEEETDRYFRRVVIEKPFGHDLVSAKALNQILLSAAKEEQLFRIDHFLGKETVQNIMALRFANGIFEPIWNRNYIDSVYITAAETLGVEMRGHYYDKTGALRDMVPNHILQVLSLIAMESPISFEAADIQNEKEKVLHAVHKMLPDEVLQSAVRGQYDAGMMEKESVNAYRREPNVASDSSTETYAALKLNINNWRWSGVPFYLRTGKRMTKRTSEVVIHFKLPPSLLFSELKNSAVSNNLLRIHLQPNEGISFRFAAKVPGSIMKLGDVEMSFQYKDYFGAACSTGYETLLYDCINGDHTLFPRASVVEEGWKIVQPVLDVWGSQSPKNFPNYAAGSWGPLEAEDLLTREGRTWDL